MPKVGVTDSHGVSLLAVNERVPIPVFVTFTEAGAGSTPPGTAENAMLKGLTDNTGPVAAAAFPKAEIGQSEYIAPVLHVVGSCAKVSGALPSPAQDPDARSRKYGVPPAVPKIAIQ